MNFVVILYSAVENSRLFVIVGHTKGAKTGASLGQKEKEYKRLHGYSKPLAGRPRGD